MISAKNLQQLLSGSKWMLLLILIAFSSCSSQKAIMPKGKTQVVKADSKPRVTVDTIKTSIYDDSNNIKDNRQNIENDDFEEDDLELEVEKDSNSHQMDADIKALVPILKDEYNVKLLLPLNSDNVEDPGLSRYVHFYAGALLALKDLNDDKIRLNVEVIDTEARGFNFESDINQILDDETDLIVGPYEKDGLRMLLERNKDSETIVVSPWQTSSRFTEDNPYYMQIKPNLREHFTKLAHYATNRYKNGDVIIIGKDDNITKSWIDFFNSEAKDITMKEDFFNPYFVSTDSLRNGPTAFFNMFKDNKVKAVIIPNYSYSDEDFIYSCLRRLSAEKRDNNFSVLGMPILYDSDKIDFEYYYSLNMKVVMSDFLDEEKDNVRKFRRDFLDEYGEIPVSDAFKGYDLIMFLGRNLKTFGKNFQFFIEGRTVEFLQSTFDIRQAGVEEVRDEEYFWDFDFYENKHLDIIKFNGTKWVKE